MKYIAWTDIQNHPEVASVALRADEKGVHYLLLRTATREGMDALAQKLIGYGFKPQADNAHSVELEGVNDGTVREVMGYLNLTPHYVEKFSGYLPVSDRYGRNPDQARGRA